ncbi:MAG: hypothetical protein ACJ0DD_05710 [Paracoccaceae bacterium]
MLNAEDTKERIRKLRLKVISEPTDSTFADNLNQDIGKSAEIIQEWKDISGSDINDKNIIENKDNFKKNVKSVLASNSQDTKNKIVDQNINFENLNTNIFSQSNIQNEIDKRIKDNSKILIELFNQRVEDLKNKIVNIENFESFKSNIFEQLGTSINNLTENFNEKIKEARQQNVEKDIEIDNLINDKSLELKKITQEKINHFSGKLASYDHKIPNIVKNLEEKIYSDINHLVDEFKSKIKVETDKFNLTNEIFKNDFTKINGNLEELDIKIEDTLNTLSSNIDNEKSENYDQFIFFKDSYNSLKRDFDDFKDSTSLKSTALASEISFQIDDLNSDFRKKTDYFNREIENTKNTISKDNDDIIKNYNEKFENLQTTISSITSQIHKDYKDLKSNFDQKVVNLEDISIKQINSIKKEINENKNNNSTIIESIKVDLEKIINQKNQSSFDKIHQVDQNIQDKFDIFSKELESYSLSLFAELKSDLENSKINSDDINEKTNSSIQNLKKEINDSKKNLFSEVFKRNDELRDAFTKNLEEMNIKFTKSFSEIKNTYELKINHFINKLDAKILKNSESNEQKIHKLFQSISELKISIDDKFSVINNSISNTNNNIRDYKKEFIDNQKVLENKFSEEQKNIIGVLKDKYKILKSKIWEEFSSFKDSDNKNLEQISKIEKLMVTLPILQKNIKTQLNNENNGLSLKLNKEISKLNNLINNLDSRILSESELIEIFQNHNLNVNISQNKKLLSKVKKEYETQKLNNKKSFSLSRIVSSMILIISVVSIFKIFS